MKRTPLFSLPRSFGAAAALAAMLASCGDNSHEAELQAMQDSIDDLEQQLEGLEAELDVVKQDRADLTAERDALARALDELAAKGRPGVALEVPFVFGSAPLELGAAYPIGGGDTIQFREVRYWLTNVALEREDHTFFEVADSYFLVEARPAQTLANGTEATVTLPANRRESIHLAGVPAGTYVGIRFSIGVDPAHNNDLSSSGGELHTLKNMTFDNGWMWFTSYIFTKTRADLAGEGGDAAVTWDNGSNADLRDVSLAFPTPLAMAVGASYTIRVPADLAALVTAVPPREQLVIGAGAPAARATLADAFRDMFSLAAAGPTP